MFGLQTLRNTQYAIRNTSGQARIPYSVLRIPCSAVRGFTLIELIVVMGLIAIMMTISVPSIRHMVSKQGLLKAAGQAQDVCMNARARAINSGTMTEVVIRADPPIMEVAGAAAKSDASGLCAHFQLDQDVAIESIRVNGINYEQSSMARVRFFPNGTCDELRLVLRRPQDNQRRGIYCEITTGLADIETDQGRLMAEVR
jgi:prepilin-type N-terminal cleavage/methylation domain-containing protein